MNGSEKILHSSAVAESKISVLKHDELFGVFDRFGDIKDEGHEEHGLYYKNTRFLSRLQLLVENRQPLLLNSHVTENNEVLAVDLANPECEEVNLAGSNIHLSRSIFLYEKSRFESIELFNYSNELISIQISILCGADFRDLFEIRGHPRDSRGEINEPLVQESGIIFRYQGLDQKTRYTRIHAHPKPSEVKDQKLIFNLDLPAHSSSHIEVEVKVDIDTTPSVNHLCFKTTQKAYQKHIWERHGVIAEVSSSHSDFNTFLNRSLADMKLLATTTEWGVYPYAGIPWFSAPFGRDGIVAALQMLTINPAFAKGVLHFLACTQGNSIDKQSDCEPGKIIHEYRFGEMADLNEVPYGKYYGSVDSTPLFVVLAGEYCRRTGDTTFVKSIWKNIKQAIHWIEEFGDRDGDGLVEYEKSSATGLIHQGWKDSNNAIFHSDGSLAQPPIALCEVQGYTFQAYRNAAWLARVFGEDSYADEWSRKQQRIKSLFTETFWVNEIDCFAIALDHEKVKCVVRSSNIGHCLFSEIVEKDLAPKIVKTLMSDNLFSGWGVRTIGKLEPNYNPMSYHNGSVWPHDNSIIGAGLAKYGYKEECLRILESIFAAANLMDFSRLPELFCGFDRTQGRNPTIYPMSCAPQAWAAGSVFLLLDACLGLSIDSLNREISFKQPRLPKFLRSLYLKNLTIAPDATISLEMVNYGNDVSINVMERSEDIGVNILK